MPYVVKRGKVEDAERTYQIGEVVPGEYGELDDMVEAGSVEWHGLHVEPIEVPIAAVEDISPAVLVADMEELIAEAGEALPEITGEVVTPYADLTNKQLRALCKERRIAQPYSYANNATLTALLVAADEQGDD